MTIKQLNSISIERRRLAQVFQGLLLSRNMLIDEFQREYLRHVKLTVKKENSREALLTSLSKSRNMKKIQKEFLDIKSRIIETQIESKKLKKIYQLAKKTYEKDILNVN